MACVALATARIPLRHQAGALDMVLSGKRASDGDWDGALQLAELLDLPG
jgi:hypothetical protein